MSRVLASLRNVNRLDLVRFASSKKQPTENLSHLRIELGSFSESIQEFSKKLKALETAIDSALNVDCTFDVQTNKVVPVHGVNEADIVKQFPFIPSGDLSQIVLPEIFKRVKLPSVTAILQQTKSEKSKIILFQWEKRMRAKLGDEGFEEYKRATLTKGTKLHDLVYGFLTGTSENDLPMEGVENLWKSIHPVIKHVEMKFNETPIRHQQLLYSGRLDCCGTINNNLNIIEWKTANERRRQTLADTYDDPVQLAAYIGAYNSAEPLQPIVHGTLVYAYKSGMPADVFHLSLAELERFWAVWLDRFYQYAHQVSNVGSVRYVDH